MEHIDRKNKAVSNMKVADHVLVMTYPIVQDPKLLKVVLQKLYLAMENSMAALLYYEKSKRNISAFNESYIPMLRIMRKELPKHSISSGYLSFLEELNDIYQSQKKSDVEFIRKEKFVFTNKDYNLKTLTKEDMKKYMVKGKLFIKEITDVVK